MVIYCGALREAFLINFEERDSNELARRFNFSKQNPNVELLFVFLQR